MDWLTTPSRFLVPDPRRLVLLLVGVGAFAATEFGRHIYRPWAYARGLSDFGLADSVGNLGGIIVQIFVSNAVLACLGNKLRCQADVIVVQTDTGASCRGGACSDRGCDDPGHRGLAQ